MATVRRRRRTGVPDRARAIRRLESRGLFVIEWTDSPGVVYPEHAHPSRELRLVLEGSMTLGTGARTHELGPGDRIELEPDEPHWARVGPDGVRYLAASDSHPGREWGATYDTKRPARPAFRDRR